MDTTAAPRILVVDDDPALRELLAEYLGASGFVVDVAGDGRQMHERMAVARPDALVLDLMLPGEDGLTLARELRRTSTLPILMLSARGEEIDRVVGLEMGADDYLGKPFSPRELLARLRALLRRAHAGGQPGAADAAAGAPPGEDAAPGAKHLHRFGPFTLDAAAWRLLRGDEEVPVTSAEFALLRIFVLHPHRVLTRDLLVEQLKGYEREAFDRSIDVRVTRLRRKIEPDPAHPVYVRTVRGEGYLFNPAGGQRA
ncbi:MAG: response regulator [Rubrivivax sp.]|nr:response regulator [Rubrivivax sp.]